MIPPRVQRSVFVLSLLLAIALLPACAPPSKTVDEPVDDVPTTSSDPSRDSGSGDGEMIVEVEEPWAKDAVIDEEEIPVTVLQSRADEFNQQQVLGDIFFPFDRQDLTEESMERLASHARWLRSNPDFGLFIEGHCDERDTDEYNLALGERRANAAREYLILLGIDAGRLQAISYGEERPVDSGNNESAWSKNRRGHFVVQVIEG
jgi:peptidoglycan-associated lipoprotein